MMIFGPMLVALIPGIIIWTLTWWLSKKGFSRLIKVLPGTIAVISALILFYISIVYIRGFEGAAYGILSFFLILVAAISFMISKVSRVSDESI
ncbi:YesK family protein [Peribacillus sp. NPDC097675]|uniref:YesK family protein n=1 Tax=Peribacillus sp. NPDC097675 TaxID=3390618 RepID=UPI003D076C75